LATWRVERLTQTQSQLRTRRSRLPEILRAFFFAALNFAHFARCADAIFVRADADTV